MASIGNGGSYVSSFIREDNNQGQLYDSPSERLYQRELLRTNDRVCEIKRVLPSNSIL